MFFSPIKQGIYTEECGDGTKYQEFMPWNYEKWWFLSMKKPDSKKQNLASEEGDEKLNSLIFKIASNCILSCNSLDRTPMQTQKKTKLY